MSSINFIDTFSPIRFPEGKHPNESLHWLGRIVEPYFDFGQEGYIAAPRDRSEHEGIPVVQPDTKKMTAGQIALKVFTVALRILSYFTVIIPFVMLLGKFIYRAENPFIAQEPIDPAEYKRFAGKLIERFSPTNRVDNEYTSLRNKVDALPTKDFSKLESFEELVELHQQIDAFQKEVTDALSRATCYLDEDEKAGLEEIITEFANLKKMLQDAIIKSAEAKAGIVTTMTQLQADVEKQFTEFDASVTAFRTAAAEAKDAASIPLEGGKKIVDEQAFPQKLADAIADFQIPRSDLLERYLVLAKGCNSLFPNIIDAALVTKIQQNLEPVGIRNLGNTCYMNSILQVISAHPGLYERLDTEVEKPETAQRAGETEAEFTRRKGLDEQDHQKNEDLRKALKLAIVAQKMRIPDAIRLAARHLNHVLYTQNVLVEGQYAQHDAQEIMNRMLNAFAFPQLEVESKKSYGSEEQGNIDHHKEAKETFLMVDIMRADPSSEQSGGKQKNTPISFSLQGLVDHHFSTKLAGNAENAWRISDDLTVNEWNEEVKLANAPDTIVIQLKRFQQVGNTLSKINTQIAVPNGGIVDFSSGSKDAGSMLYEVVGVVQQSGSLSGGHYTANVKKGSEWFQCNDSSVRATSPEHISHNGYLYVLKKV